MNRVSLFALLLIVAACGVEKQNIIKPHTYVQNVGLTPITLEKQVNSCLENTDQGNQDHVYGVMQFLQGESVRRDLDLSGFALQDQFLSSSAVSAVLYDAQVVLQRYFDNGALIGQEFSLRNNGADKKLFVCQDTKEYKRYSYENAGLSVAHTITKTARRLESYGVIAPAPVSVYLSSSAYERLSEERPDDVLHQDKSITDNAYYVSHLNAIVFLPQSEESARGERFGSVPLWELPVVASHEYGHHIFHSLLGTSSLDIGISSTCYASSYEYEAILQTSEGKIGKLLGAVNEAFADLVAYYTLDPVEVGLKGISCMQFNREVESRSFANGELKQLSSLVLETFWSGTRRTGGGCFNPDYSQLHALGAIISNTFDVLVTHVAGSQARASLRSSSQKINILTAWLKRLASEHEKLSALGEEQYLANAYAMYVELLLDNPEDRFSFAECQLIKDLAPELEAMEAKLTSLGC